MLKNIVVVYDFGRSVGGINPVAIRPAEVLSESYNVYYCCAEDDFESVGNDLITRVPLSKAASEDAGEISRAFSSIWSLSAKNNLSVLLNNLDPAETVVHFHGWGMALSASVLNVANKLGFRMIYTAHDYSIVCPNGVYYDFVKQQDCRSRPMSLECITKNCDKSNYAIKAHRVIRKTLERLTVNVFEVFERIICVSETVMQVLIECGAPPEKLTVIANPSCNETSSVDVVNNHVYAYVGRITPEKGVEDFCQAVTLAKVDALIIGGGDGVDDLKKQYPNITFTGWVDKKEIHGYLSKARCVVVPSRWREASGLVVEEAMSLGIPVIVSSETGAAEKIKKYGGGLIFEKGNVNALAAEIRKLASKNLIFSLSEKCLSVRGDFISFSAYAVLLQKLYGR
jgi:glycosyltransferase involved in cell wall biosynthesis